MSSADLFVHQSDGSVTYEGKKLIAYIPEHYETYSLFKLAETVTALAVVVPVTVTVVPEAEAASISTSLSLA